jgi:hypothetical protein
MALEAMLAAEMHFLYNCASWASVVAGTCRALADAVARDWPRIAVSVDRVAEASVRAVERGDTAGLRMLARLATVPLEVLETATAQGRWDLVEWFIRVSNDPIPDKARGALIRAGRKDLLPAHYHPRSVRALIADSLMLTDEVLEAFVADIPEIVDAATAKSAHFRNWPFIAHWAGRPIGRRIHVESFDYRTRLNLCSDVISNVESESSEYTVTLHTAGGVDLPIAPIVVMQYAEVYLLFTAPYGFSGPFRASYTSHMLPIRNGSEMLEGDGVLLEEGAIRVLFEEGVVRRIWDHGGSN